MGILDKATTVAEDPGSWSTQIYGPSGAGKTVLACGAVGALLVDCEEGRRSLLNHPELVAVPIIKATTLDRARQVAIDLANDKDEAIKTVILDTSTSLQQIDMTNQMKNLGGNRDQDLPSQAEFNKNNRRIARLIQDYLTACKRTSRNLIVLAHVKEEKDNAGLTTLIRPGTSPGLTQAIAPLMDGIFYLSAVADNNGLVERELWTISTRKVNGKNRFGSLPSKIENPHISLLEAAAEKQRQTALQLLKDKTNNA